MTLVVMGIDALDPDYVDPERHGNLCLNRHRSIETISSESTGLPHTHEIWPTIITGLTPDEHGLKIGQGLEWNNPLLNLGRSIANHVVPNHVQTKIGKWLLENTEEAAFNAPVSYYKEKEISTVFDGSKHKAIGLPNYRDSKEGLDKEDELRKQMGELFERNPDRDPDYKHVSSDPGQFYELCMEMSMVRIARTRRALRGRRYEFVFGYTGGLDLIGHVTYDDVELHMRAYDELDDFVGELASDLGPEDELLIVSDHGLQDGWHTEEAFLSGTDPDIVDSVDSVLDVREALERELEQGDHAPETVTGRREIGDSEKGEGVKQHLEDLGYR